MRKKRTKYTAGEIGRVRVVEDSLPAPQALAKVQRKSATHTEAELRAMAKRGESKTDWKAAAKKPLSSGDDPDDAMEETDWATTELPLPRRKT